ncbi:ABC transporter ATP-binding protein [Weissella sagaensis]|uniref:ABC transporter ATP-binding protein n=1 Tax=Weissella sagaensis TaxID=2559928 RepID=UPI0005A82D71|nr:ATP-binding cassette domain-containing protein [Weissella sagaensis]QEA57904.1 ATP-binding cassette domain-containing protein [Weissella hellenica]UEG67052.1 ATP-binding cassette domain-containing protein [Weissella hellenica]
MNNTLEIKHLEKNFGKKKILTDVSFTVTKGHIVGLVGANGAGKTTIMKAILGLVGFSNGTITINGESVSLNKHQALSKVGALIENPGIYPYLTGWDHLRLFAEKNITKSMMTELVSALKMDKYIHQKAKGYSLGMKQKLGIALAFLNNPDFVILDEPMNGLDPQATFDLRQLITTKANEGTTFLISSHILGELEKLAKDLVIIDRGQIIKQTTTDELLSTGEKYFVLQTSDDDRAQQLLLDHNFNLKEDISILVPNIDNNSLANALKVLINNNIDVLDVQHKDNDLEVSLLELLQHGEEGVK